MSRFYVPKENVNLKKNEVTVDGHEARHVIDVMRLKEGDKIIVFDGTGNEYSGFIKKTNNRSKKVVVEVIRTDKHVTEDLPEIILAQGMPKKGKMDYIVEKTTELGVSRIIPLITERTIVRPDDAACTKVVARWERIAVESSKQCGRQDIPKISPVTGYAELIQTIDEYDLVLLACLTGKTTPLKKALEGFKAGKVLVLIGPEGDFTTEEIKMADKENSKFVSLGKKVLKSDTAGLFVLSALSYEFSDICNKNAGL